MADKDSRRLKLPGDFIESLAALLKAKPPDEGWDEPEEPDIDLEEETSDPDRGT